jgi:hypothetical protein
MNYKQMLDKLAELEARVDALERGQRKQTQITPAPRYIDNMPRIEFSPTWPIPPYTITCKDMQGKEFH